MVTTVRPPSPLIEIRLEHETIRATRGHPFWVSGVGWQMAKELKAAQWLHTTSGPALIESAEQNGRSRMLQYDRGRFQHLLRRRRSSAGA